ncbi:MAG: response regulator, partial [bacterium]|nr:response regulator [bacterium]
MREKKENSESSSKPLVLAAIHDEDLWNELKDTLQKRFRVRRETDGLRAIDIIFLLRPAAVIAESGLPGMSGILLARLLGHNRYLIKLPVVLILSREYLIEEFWAKDSGALDIVQKRDALELIRSLEIAISPRTAITDEEWDLAEAGIQTQGGPAAGVAAELENQLISASILARLGEIDFAGETKLGESHNPVPEFIWKALTALSTVLEFAQASVTLWETNELYIVENDVFKDILDENAFIEESKASAILYHGPHSSTHDPEVRRLPSVHHLLPGPTGPARTFFALPL